MTARFWQNGEKTKRLFVSLPPHRSKLVVMIGECLILDADICHTRGRTTRRRPMPPASSWFLVSRGSIIENLLLGLLTTWWRPWKIVHISSHWCGREVSNTTAVCYRSTTSSNTSSSINWSIHSFSFLFLLHLTRNFDCWNLEYKGLTGCLLPFVVQPSRFNSSSTWYKNKYHIGASWKSWSSFRYKKYY